MQRRLSSRRLGLFSLRLFQPLPEAVNPLVSPPQTEERIKEIEAEIQAVYTNHPELERKLDEPRL
jgi:hypothetical protein